MKFFETSKYHSFKKSTYITLRWIGVIGQLIAVNFVYFFLNSNFDFITSNIIIFLAIIIISTKQFVRIYKNFDVNYNNYPWPKYYSENLEKGDTVRLIGVIPSTNWKGELQLKVDPYARVEKADSSEDGDIGLFDFRARWNIVGRVAYTTFKSGIGKNGKPWARKGLVLLDETSRVTVEGWDNSWPSIYNTLQQGDEVAILNVSLDAWAMDVKANLEKGSTMHIISRSTD